MVLFIRMILPVLLLVALGCDKVEQSYTTALPETAQRVVAIVEAIDDACSDSEYLFVRSWNGRWIGTDCDTEIELHPNGVAVLIEYGYDVNTYDGTYSIKETSKTNTAEINLALPTYEGGWPPMAVYRDGSDLLLIPTDSPLGFAFGNRSAATVPGGAGSFWPFRQVPVPERKE